MHDVDLALRALVATSIFFVWVVRYDNIVAEFREYGLPDWVRDLVGILKLTFAVMLLIAGEGSQLTSIAAWGIALLMLCAQGVHLRARTALGRRLPSLGLAALGIYLAV